MKLYYSKSDLKKITEKELLELTTFGEDNAYFYSDLDKIQKEDGEFSFLFKDKTVIYTQSEETYKEIILGKSRFEMLSISLKENEDAENKANEFREEMRTVVTNQMTEVHKTLKVLNTNIVISTQDLESRVQKSVKDNDSKMDSLVREWKDKIERLEEFDTKSYNIKMVKLDKIIEAFDELLK